MHSRTTSNNTGSQDDGDHTDTTSGISEANASAERLKKNEDDVKDPRAFVFFFCMKAMEA
jgi:hypothetical protein